MTTCLSSASAPECGFVQRPKRPGVPIRQTVPSRVTLIIGIICKDCVVMACDTQVTAGNSKRTDGTKLRTVGFDNMSALVAQAGSLSYSNRYIDILRKLAEKSSPQSVVEVGEMMNEAMELFRKQLRASHFNCSSDKLDAILASKEKECSILLGFHLNKKPHLVSIQLNDPNYRECTSHYEAEGTGALLGEYLLSEHATPNMSRDFASTIAVYIVEIVKKYDIYCSGQTVVGIAFGPGGVGNPKWRSRTRLLNQDVVKDYAELIMQAEVTTREQRNKIIHTEFALQDAIFQKEMREEQERWRTNPPPLTQADIDELTGGENPNVPDDQ